MKDPYCLWRTLDVDTKTLPTGSISSSSTIQASLEGAEKSSVLPPSDDADVSINYGLRRRLAVYLPLQEVRRRKLEEAEMTIKMRNDGREGRGGIKERLA